MSLVKHWICDGCKATENELPKTWYPVGKGKDAEHFCTIQCLLRVFMPKGEIEKKKLDKEARESA